MRTSIALDAGLNPVPVIAPAAHDSTSAVAGESLDLSLATVERFWIHASSWVVRHGIPFNARQVTVRDSAAVLGGARARKRRKSRSKIRIRKRIKSKRKSRRRKAPAAACQS